MYRRTFLRSTLATLPTLLLTPSLSLALPTRRQVRVRGQVRTPGGRGLAGVRVSDGRSVVLTDAEGTYTLLADRRQPFVFASIPAGHAIPQGPKGSAKHYQALRADDEQTAVFDFEPLGESDDRHAFLVLADPQTQNAYEMGLFHAQTVPDVQQTVSRLGAPVFGVGCGDLMFNELSLFPEYERAVGAMGVPFFQVVGNHDLDFDAPTDEGSTRTFRQHFGPTYYSFDRGEIHYVVLDDVAWLGNQYVGYVDDLQLSWLAADLSTVEPGRTVVVFLHIPLLGTGDVRAGKSNPSPGGAVANREAIYALLEPFNAHVMSGHTHESEHVFEGGVHEHIHGTVCGAWWTGPICYDGTPSGYGVYEANGSALAWHYKATGEARDVQLRAYPRGTDPSAPDEVVANVWNWDPEWQVMLYADGMRRGPMARRRGRDPLSVDLHTGPEKPERRGWVEPVFTDHLFYAPVEAGATDVWIEATDRFGNVYRATPTALG